MTDAVRRDAEERREQGAEPRERAESHELLHRASGREDVPAEDQRVHLEGPRRREIGGPLEAEAAYAERSESASFSIHSI